MGVSSWGQTDNVFAGRSVLLIGAGCALGRVLARQYATAGARVIAVDRDAVELEKIAAFNPSQINTLRLECLNGEALRKFSAIWADEPLDALVHLQPFRHGTAPGAALASVVTLTDGLQSALSRGEGRVLILYRAAGVTSSLQQQAYGPAWDRLPVLLARAFSTKALLVNALRLTWGREAPLSGKQVVEAALRLTAPRPSELTGTVLHMGAPEA